MLQIDFLGLLQQLSLLVGGAVGTYGITELVKRAKTIPINPGQKARIRSVAVIVATLAAVGIKFVDGDVDVGSVQEGALTILEALAVFMGATGIHAATKPE